MPGSDVSVEANYADAITNATLTVDTPSANTTLPTTGTLTWGDNNSLDVSIYWIEDGKQQASTTAKYNTTYQVAAVIPQDSASSRYFSKAITKDSITVIYGESSDTANTAKVDEQGSLIILGNGITTSKAKITSVEEASITITEDQEITTDMLPSTATVQAEDEQTYSVSVDTTYVPDVQDDDGKKYIELSLNISDTDSVINTDNMVLRVNITNLVIPETPIITSTDNEDGTKSISLSCSTKGATIYYRIDGGDIQTYTKPFELSGTEGTKTTPILLQHGQQSLILFLL